MSFGAVTKDVAPQGFVYNKEGNAYTITGYTGKEKSITVPAEYDGLPVTKMQGDYGIGVFARKDFTSVTIPDTITEIGQNTSNNRSKLATAQISKDSSGSVQVRISLSNRRLI